MAPTWVDAMRSVDPATEVIAGITAGDMVYAMEPGPAEGLRHGGAEYVGGHIEWYAPENRGPHPAVVLVHGGSWTDGDHSMHLRHARDLAALGYVAATVDYRLVPAVSWPVPLDDVHAAIAWLRADPLDLGADPWRVAVVGGSAGGHLAALAALAPSDYPPPAAAVLWYPPLRLRSTLDVPDLGDVVATTFGDGLDDASPVTYVAPGAPPILTMTGDRDPVLPLADVRAFHAALTAAGVDNDLVVYPDPRHGFDLTEQWYGDCFARMAAFLQDRLNSGMRSSGAGTETHAGPS